MDFKTELNQTRQSILEAILPEVVFDGWSDASFKSACQNAKIDQAHAKIAFPNGAIDVAIYMHKSDDERMKDALTTQMSALEGISAKIEHAINLRLEIAASNKDAVRQAATLFALPQYAFQGSSLIWHTADTIWKAIGDQTQGFGYYSKRSTLCAVYSSALLYWLQDQSPNAQDTSAFVARRIADMGSFGKFTSQFKRKPA